MINKITEAVRYIQNICSAEPSIGIVLGSGLSNFTDEIVIEAEVPYADIPHFPVSTVEGHSGKLILGKLSGKQVVAMAGRFHYYEGYAAAEVVFPVRVMKFLGIKTLLLSNAAGAVNPAYKVGDLMIIKDHISQLTVNPLIGENDNGLGPRFPDMSEPYKKSLINTAKEIAKSRGIRVHEGIYIGVTGPTFETRAEYMMIRFMGGDVVGMSTVQEVIAAAHMGLHCFAMSVITDIGLREEDNIITHEEVLQAARAAEPDFAYVFKELVARI